MKLLISLACVIGLTACASAPAPQFTQKEYTTYSEYIAGSYKCLMADYMTPSEYADAIEGADYFMSLYSYDKETLDRTINTKLNSIHASKTVCKTIATRVSQTLNSMASHKEANKVSTPVYVAPVNNGVNKPIWCNTVGTVTMCN